MSVLMPGMRGSNSRSGRTQVYTKKRKLAKDADAAWKRIGKRIAAFNRRYT